jgi:hypothetical protein
MPLDAIVQNYEEAKKEIETGYRNIWKANGRIKSIIGDYNFSDYKVMDSQAINRDTAEMKKKVWRYILNKVEIYNLISDKRRKELDDQLEKGELPEISVENIQSTLDSLLNNIGNLYKETVQESFEWLRPPGSRHKTNTEYEVGKMKGVS